MIPAATQIWPDDLARRYRAAGHWRNETFGQVLRDRATSHPDRIALVEGDTQWTYAELDAHADAIAAGLLARGFQPGDRVVVHLPNRKVFFSVIFGLFRAGILPVYALPAHRITEIEHIARSSFARGYVIAERHDGFDYRELAAELQRRVPGVEQVFVDGDAGAYTSLDALEAEGRNSPAPTYQPQASDVAFMQISGGSTGLSKLIPRTHDDYIYTLRESDRICGLTEDTVFLAVLPVAHNFPMSSPGVLGAIYVGARIVLSPSPSPDTAFPLIEQHRASMVSLVPQLLLVWLEAAAQSRHDISSLQVIQVGGAKLLPEVARRVRPVLGVTLQQVFGMAEGLVNYTRLDDPEERIVHTQGRPISADDEVLVVDDQGQPVAAGEAGYLLTRGPYTIRGYYNDASANARSFTDDGFYRTGDIVKRDADGYLTVQGRATDHINRAGEKISAEEIEDHLLVHPQVYDAAIVSIPDEYLGERTCAFIIPKNGKPRTIEIKNWIRSRGLAEFKVPDQVVFVTEFASTAAGKISRKELRAALRAQLAEQENQQQ